MEICQDPNILSETLMIIRILKIIFIIAPIILIIMMGSDFFLGVISNDADIKKSSTTAIRRLITCICLFLVPTFINVFISLLNDLGIDNGYIACITNANSEYIENRRLEIADEYLKVAKEKEDRESVVIAERAINDIKDETERENRIKEIRTIEDKIKEREKEEEEKNKDIIFTKNYLKFYNSLSVLHSGQSSNDNTVELFESAGKANFYAAECDLRLNGSTLYCAHDRAPSLATKFEEYIKICKKHNMKAILDLKWPSNPNWVIYNFYTMIDTVANYIKNNNLQNIVFVQTTDLDVINRINKIASNVKYWYLVEDYNGNNLYNRLINNMESLKKGGVETVNISHLLAYEDRIKTIKNNNLKLCVYSVNTNASRLKFSNYGADYIMSDNLQ